MLAGPVDVDADADVVTELIFGQEVSMMIGAESLVRKWEELNVVHYRAEV
jgi:hypothetical protein